MTNVLRKDKLANKKKITMSLEAKISSMSLSGKRTVAYSERGSIEKQFRAKVWESESLKS